MAKLCTFLLGAVFSTLFVACAADSCLNKDSPLGGQQLSFCPANGAWGCCGVGDDRRLAEKLASAELQTKEGRKCAEALHLVLCSECDPHASFFFPNQSVVGPRAPFLCQGGLCERLYRSCRDVRMRDSLFTQARATIGELYPTVDTFAAVFCKDPCGEAGHCLGKAPLEVLEPPPGRPHARVLQTSSTPSKLCFERTYNESVLNLVGHPLNTNFAVVGDQAGHMHLMYIPVAGSGKPMVKEVDAWLDLSSRVLNNGERGLLSFAFHPKYITNGRLYVSYICDSRVHKDCQGPCACNANIGCTVASSGDPGCYSNTIIAEFTVATPLDVRAKPIPTETRRLLTYARLFSNHNGGQIFFGHDGYLYITSGDGGSGGDPYFTAQNPRSFLGKVLRIDVDNKAAGKNYSIPKNNPFVNQANALGEIYALGLRNPWRCSQDSSTETIICGDVGQNNVEEVDIINSGGNYGWSVYEGTTVFKANKNVTIGTLTKPIFEYAHPGYNSPGIPVGGICVIGGAIYRAFRNTCLFGKYLYNDLNGNMWAGTIFPPAGTARSTALVTRSCSPQSPYACNSGSFGSMWTWAIDTRRDVYVLSSSGAYRITNLTSCGVKC